jgi:hypothetical protein
MNTHGHQDVAKAAGLPELKAAFQQSMSDPRLSAFYLGNWITDLSQVVDPVAGATARDKIEDFVDDAFDTLLNAVYSLQKDELLPLTGWFDYDSVIRMLKPKVSREITVLFNALFINDPDGKTSWFKAVQPGVLLKGYFKFVHPEVGSQQLRMDLGAYLAVFDALFKQYYPHEHLDRPVHPNPVPVTPGTKAIQYDDRKAQGPRSGQASQSPDLYWYLRDNIEILAGLLADLDLNWASTYLSQSGQDKDIGWNIGLARLGQALHGVEDFFAHSNFIEHAARVMGNKYLPKWYQFDHHRFLKRLKHYNFQNIPDDWTKNTDEDYVVTGYFDFQDTLVSLLHLVEGGLLGLLDFNTRDVTRDIRHIHDFVVDVPGTDEAIVKRADKVVHDFLEVIDDPKKLNAENEGNDVVAAILWFIQNSPLDSVNKFIDAVREPTTDVKVFEKLIDRMPLFSDIQKLSPQHIHPDHAARIFKAFFDFTRQITTTIRFGQMAISLYEVTQTVLEFCANPLLWLRKEMTGKLAKLLLNYALYYPKEAMYYALEMERIGCHSLISKDHGEEVLYKEMKDCATAAHYYIVKTMLRWGEPGHAGLSENQKWVNWLELLEFFLCHPAVNVVWAVPKEVPVDTVHVPTTEERLRGLNQLLKDLAAKYQPVVLKPTGLPFDHKTILHANCSTRVKRFNFVPLLEEAVIPLIAPSLTVPLRLRRIIIPYLKLNVVVCDPTAVDPRWYMPVMKDGWEAIKTQSRHTLAFHPNRDGAVQQMNRGKNLRMQWEQFYRPT